MLSFCTFIYALFVGQITNIYWRPFSKLIIWKQFGPNKLSALCPVSSLIIAGHLPIPWDLLHLTHLYWRSQLALAWPILWQFLNWKSLVFFQLFPAYSLEGNSIYLCKSSCWFVCFNLHDMVEAIRPIFVEIEFTDLSYFYFTFCKLDKFLQYFWQLKTLCTFAKITFSKTKKKDFKIQMNPLLNKKFSFFKMYLNSWWYEIHLDLNIHHNHLSIYIFIKWEEI